MNATQDPAVIEANLLAALMAWFAAGQPHGHSLFDLFACHPTIIDAPVVPKEIFLPLPPIEVVGQPIDYGGSGP